ncbi:NAD(P)-dependent oxidoreductase [Streptomyces sp. NPDC057011]|uniref:NAD(P)-dependent oxidoreductase n=1 Tax=unclassified Streptomyces TaxID=2593676 RepID=UPI0036300D85
MQIAVIGHTGMGGKALTDVLASRGHHVTGISRSAKPSEDRAGLTNVAADVFDVDTMSVLLEGHDAVVSMFSGGHEVDLEVYYRQAEGTRRLLKAFRQAGGSYLLYVGGAASLYVRPGVQMFDDPRFPSWYFGVMPAEHLRWLGEITGVGFFHDAARRKEDGTVPPGQTDPELEAMVASWDRVPLLEGCRIALDLFEGRQDIAWSFLSPPWLYRPGAGKGGYRTGIDDMIFDDGIPSGIALPDLALAVADEAERQQFVHRHWTVAEPLEAEG